MKISRRKILSFLSFIGIPISWFTSKAKEPNAQECFGSSPSFEQRNVNKDTLKYPNEFGELDYEVATTDGKKQIIRAHSIETELSNPADEYGRPDFRFPFHGAIPPYETEWKGRYTLFRNGKGPYFGIVGSFKTDKIVSIRSL